MRSALSAVSFVAFLSLGAFAQAPTVVDTERSALEKALQSDDLPEKDPLSLALKTLPADVRRYDEHVVTLANPFLDGRLPGTPGMEVASRYMEYWWQKAGIVPAFPSPNGAARSSWRQAFLMGSSQKVGEQRLSLEGATLTLTPGSSADFVYSGLGAGGRVSNAPLVFVGYGIESGPNGYSSFGPEDDLQGKVALVLRFEPMNAEGKSRWAEGSSPWSRLSTMQDRIRELANRGLAGVLLVNTPGAADPRNAVLPAAGSGGRTAEFPVAQLATSAAEKLVAAALPNGPSLLELRKKADEGRVIQELGRVTLEVAIEEQPLIAENVGGLLQGRGKLADELVVIGAHLDHLGMGEFGSRSGPGTLHPGADDNASGSAALLILADKLAASYAAAPANADLRTIFFLAFSAEESGLNGSQHYCRHPIAPLAQHAFMINFDMIGRIENKRLSVSGADSGAGLADFLAPYFAATPLRIVHANGMSGASDHAPFYRAKIPVLFSIIADFHGDYHTPQDVSEKLNRVDAVHTIRLYHQIALGLAQRAERFAFQAPPPAPEGTAAAPARVGNVRFGIGPGTYDPNAKDGVLVGSVSPGLPAEKAGIKAGDVLVEWNGAKLENVEQWMPLFTAHKPGDKVKVGLRRGAEKLTVEVTLVGTTNNG